MAEDPRPYLEGTDLEDYENYRKLAKEATDNRWSHWWRMMIYKDKVVPHPHDHVVVFESPRKDEDNCVVLLPTPQMLGELMYGGIHPYIEEWWDMKLLCKGHDGTVKVVRKAEEFAFIENHGLAGQWVVDATGLHTKPMQEKLTYEQSLEYIIMKDIPMQVWHRQLTNRPKLAIIPHSLVPDRDFRDAWTFNEDWKDAA